MSAIRARKLDAAPVPTEQGHHERAVVGDGHHRRLRALVAEDRRHRPDEDPGRADADDRAFPADEQPAQVQHRLGEQPIRVVDTPLQSVHFGIAESGGDAPREPARARGERDHRDPGADLGAQRHANPRRCTRTIEK